MVEIVNIKGNVVSVRDDLAERVAVCRRCKGFKKLCKTDYFRFDPFLWMWHDIVCPSCNGKGLYYPPVSLPHNPARERTQKEDTQV